MISVPGTDIATRPRCQLICFNFPLHADSWPQALALLADPRAAPTALALLNDLVDTVWHAAGDQSADLSWCAPLQHLRPA